MIPIQTSTAGDQHEESYPAPCKIDVTMCNSSAPLLADHSSDPLPDLVTGHDHHTQDATSPNLTTSPSISCTIRPSRLSKAWTRTGMVVYEVVASTPALDICPVMWLYLDNG